MPTTAEDAANIAMISPSHFRYLFKNITGKTYVEYVNGIRVQKAMERLRESNGNVLDICYAVGFESIANFNRVFKRIVGTSPTEFRKQGL
jgi:AraC-like DNA-binding protein